MSGEIYASILEARKNMQMPPLNGVGRAGKNGSREYKYALLSDVLKCVMPPLMDAGVLLTQRIQEGVLKTVAYKDGEEAVLDERRVNLSGSSQEQGSAETYAKRYALCTVFCLSGLEDDDGQAAMTQQPMGDYTANVKRRMWNAIKAWAESQGLDAREEAQKVKQRDGWHESPEMYEAVAYEFECALEDMR